MRPTNSNPSYPEIEDLNEINVVPLVDVMLVLLVIFMVTAPLAVGGLAVKLPQSSVNNKSVGSEPLVITIKENGSYFIAKESVARANLEQRLGTVLALRKSRRVYIRADRRVTHGKVVYAMSAAQQAGASTIKILTKVSQNKK